jgi:hypothetical protein
VAEQLFRSLALQSFLSGLAFLFNTELTEDTENANQLDSLRFCGTQNLL